MGLAVAVWSSISSTIGHMLWVCWTGGYLLGPREWAGLGHVWLSRPGPWAPYLKATSTMKCKKRCKWLVGFAESSFLLVVVELNRTMFNYHAALWPREMKFGWERWMKAVSTIYWIGKVKKKQKKKEISYVVCLMLNHHFMFLLPYDPFKINFLTL